MVARKFVVSHNDSCFDVEYNTDDGLEVFKFQLFSLSLIPPDEQKIVSGNDGRPISDDSDLNSVSDKLRLLSTNEEGKSKEPETSSTNKASSSTNADMIISDEELARMLQAEEDALMLQQYVASEDCGEMEQRLRPYIDQVLMYEDPVRQEAACNTVHFHELEEKALISLAKEGNFDPTKTERDHAFLLQLLFWFKQSFSWVHAPPCDGCGNDTIGIGKGAALPMELQYGGYRVELYHCKLCSKTTRFPRYNDPIKLVETRKGRCGEWAKCFTLYCRAFDYESRLILDFTDHVWTECFSNHLGRWMHLDPCEGIYDKPMLYEKGWNKNLTYVIAISKDGVCDVTKRYSRKWHEVLSRRTITTEPALSSILAKLTKECRKGYSSESVAVLEERDKDELQYLESVLHTREDSSVSLPGRLSGDRVWRTLRSEHGSGDSLSCSFCPVRACVDEHVTQIFNAFGPLFSKLLSNSLSELQTVDVLKVFKSIIIDLKSKPFRTRRTSITSKTDSTKLFAHEASAFCQLFKALELNWDLQSDELHVYLADDPVKTSLALPVAFDALNDIIQSLHQYNFSSIESLSLPLVRLSRIHSGSVLASGEELPFGIATSAFDGLRSSKWEEPNGAKGGWLVYKLKDDQMSELVAYDMMSADDAPERDPMDWVVEGSADGGSSWHLLDRQAGQRFESRFQRMTFKIDSGGVKSNVFRFRFLAVRDGKATPRLQIGSVDLYANILT